MISRLISLLFFLSCLAGCTPQQYATYPEYYHVADRINEDWVQTQPYVVLISIDGFRFDYAEKFGAKNLLQFVKDGVTSSSLIPQFPSKTFPNHYSIATGLYLENHGIVHNEFYSRERNEIYTISDKKVKQDGSWYGGLPIWLLAEQQGMLSANMFWIGSDADIRGARPAYYYDYKGDMPDSIRFQQILSWLQLKPDRRPHLLSAYFSKVDSQGHRFGPEADQTKQAVLELDRLFGAFMKALDKLELPIHVILVSDHGMTAINRGEDVSDVDFSECQVVKSLPPMIYCEDSQKVETIANQLEENEFITVLRRNELPDSLHWNHPDRIGDLILLTDAPRVILFEPERVSGGTHGYHPSNQS